MPRKVTVQFDASEVDDFIDHVKELTRHDLISHREAAKRLDFLKGNLHQFVKITTKAVD